MTVEAELVRLLHAPLDDLALEVEQIVAPPEVDEWQAPDQDRAALRRWRLPHRCGMTVSIQSETTPQLAPNVVGVEERRLLGPDDHVHQLGWWGADDRTAALDVTTDGRVLAILPTPITAEDFHPRLREHYAGLYVPSVCFIDSSLTRFIEIAWRWNAVLPGLAKLTEIGQSPYQVDILEQGSDRLEACLKAVLAEFRRIDPDLDTDQTKSLWIERVREYPSDQRPTRGGLRNRPPATRSR